MLTLELDTAASMKILVKVLTEEMAMESIGVEMLLLATITMGII